MMLVYFAHPKIQRWRAEVHQADTGRFHVITVDSRHCWNDTPIKVDDRVLYDFPERIPAYAKKLTEQAFDWLEKNRKELEK